MQENTYEIYLDNNASTKVDKETAEYIKLFLNKEYANPSSSNIFGKRIRDYLESARGKIAKSINADKSEIIFTGSGTESNNMAIFGILYANPDKKHIITSKVEHKSVLNVCKFLEDKGYKVTYLNVDNNGIVDLGQLKHSISKNTALVSIMYVNNETGVISPISEISKICRSKNVVFHTDGIQAFGKEHISSKTADLVSLSAHKVYGPKGVGALYIRNGINVMPYIIGGGQENGLRAGTHNVAGIMGFSMICDKISELIQLQNTKVKKLRDQFEQSLLKTMKDIKINGINSSRVSNTSNISFSGCSGGAMVIMLSELNIYVSTGSACSSYEDDVSHVLTAMGLNKKSADSSIRFSFGKNNTEEEIIYVVDRIKEVVKRLKNDKKIT